MKINKKFNWLKNSDFYKSLNGSDNRVEDNPEINCRLCSKYTKDINEFLDAISFWGVYYLPPEFYILFFNTRPLKKLQDMYERTNNTSNLYEFFIYILKLDFKTLKYQLCKLASEKGYLDILIYAHEHAHKNNLRFSMTEISSYAYIGGHLECLEYLYKHKLSEKKYLLLLPK
uniref:Ankyrin repeat protein n=1 Tax=viral metagenome TaxID=1070528 RepID=A0A6C0AF58_9ZZZZ